MLSTHLDFLYVYNLAPTADRTVMSFMSSYSACLVVFWVVFVLVLRASDIEHAHV